MSALSSFLAWHFTNPPSRLALGLLAGAASLGAFSIARFILSSPLPRDSERPHLPKNAIEQLPYPPDALPGAREVDSPYGSIRVYEWGPSDGHPVLLVHGISTPSVALGPLAHRLVRRGCRVMLFDLFGRGYSSGPSTSSYRYDAALYTSQILLCLRSSVQSWETFTLIGYSLGGAIALDFASYFPGQIANLILIAPGGLIRAKHISWKSRLLYSTSWIIPEWVTERLVKQRLWTGQPVTKSIEPEPKSIHNRQDSSDRKGGLRSDEVYRSSHHALISGKPHSTAGNVVDWQILHHPGFIPAFVSTIRYAPIHNQHNRWKILRKHMEQGSTSGLDQVHLVLGENDPIILDDELIEDATEILSRRYVNIKVIMNAGHEVAFSHAQAISDLVGDILHL